MKYKCKGYLKTLFVQQLAAQGKVVARNFRVTHAININAVNQNIGVAAKCGIAS